MPRSRRWITRQGLNQSRLGRKRRTVGPCFSVVTRSRSSRRPVGCRRSSRVRSSSGCAGCATTSGSNRSSTRPPGSSRATPEERAADLHAAWSDPSIRAVFASIGGDDQITVLKHLDPAVFQADPKPFFGYSDNTNLLNFLYSLGIAGLPRRQRDGAVRPRRRDAPGHRALAARGDVHRRRLRTDAREGLDRPRPRLGRPGEPGDRAAAVPRHRLDLERVAAPVSGKLWGGCLEILDWQLSANRWMLPTESYGGVLFGETSEEMPSSETVYRILRNFGERGLLERFDAVLWGRPKSCSLIHRAHRRGVGRLRHRPVPRSRPRASRVQPERRRRERPRHRPHRPPATPPVRRPDQDRPGRGTDHSHLLTLVLVRAGFGSG